MKVFYASAEVARTMVICEATLYPLKCSSWGVVGQPWWGGSQAFSLACCLVLLSLFWAHLL